MEILTRIEYWLLNAATYSALYTATVKKLNNFFRESPTDFVFVITPCEEEVSCYIAFTMYKSVCCAVQRSVQNGLRAKRYGSSTHSPCIANWFGINDHHRFCWYHISFCWLLLFETKNDCNVGLHKLHNKSWHTCTVKLQKHVLRILAQTSSDDSKMGVRI